MPPSITKALKFVSSLPWLSMAALLICVLFTISAAALNLNRFWQYESGYYDFGIFDRAIWEVSRFKPPVIDHFIFPGKIIWADHFNPSIFLLTPIYWIISRSEGLLIIQDIMVGASGFVLFMIGSKTLKNKIMSVLVMLSYFLFVGLQNAVFFDFHELTSMTLFLMLTYWAIINRRLKLFYLFFILTLGFKESLFILGIGISVFVWFHNPKWRKHALTAMAISFIWGLTAIKVIIPFFSGRNYYYGPDLSGGAVAIVTRLFFPAIKPKTVLLVLNSFAFLPLLVPSLWPILAFNFVHRFLNSAPERWDLGLHYNAEIAPTLALAALLAIAAIQSKLGRKFAVIAVMLLFVTSFYMYRFVLHGPFMMAFNPVFYKHTGDFKFLDELISRVPPQVSVAAQNNLASRLLRNDVSILRDKYGENKPEYIVLDLRPGQNPNNFLGIKDPEKLLQTLKKDSDYSLYYKKNDQYIFKRTNLR